MLVKLPQVMVNVAVDNPVSAAAGKPLQKAIEDKTRVLASRGRILVRPSGTEPLLRVMVEGEDQAEVRAIAEDLAGIAAGA